MIGPLINTSCNELQTEGSPEIGEISNKKPRCRFFGARDLTVVPCRVLEAAGSYLGLILLAWRVCWRSGQCLSVCLWSRGQIAVSVEVRHERRHRKVSSSFYRHYLQALCRRHDDLWRHLVLQYAVQDCHVTVTLWVTVHAHACSLFRLFRARTWWTPPERDIHGEQRRSHVHDETVRYVLNMYMLSCWCYRQTGEVNCGIKCMTSFHVDPADLGHVTVSTADDPVMSLEVSGKIGFIFGSFTKESFFNRKPK